MDSTVDEGHELLLSSIGGIACSLASWESHGYLDGEALLLVGSLLMLLQSLLMNAYGSISLT